MFDFVRHIEPAVAARATGEMRRIYGFDSQPQGPDVAEGQARSQPSKKSAHNVKIAA